MLDYRKMYFQLAAKVADALDILLKAQQEGEAELMNEERFPGFKVLAIKDEDRHNQKHGVILLRMI
ncbi:hypothetical protein [Desulfosporosinus sp. OT]|uniref:hypothetical protein n=1 Tax=Desulfosporosinus sp. OT TaxID=913865 RepID=UPI000223A151|nr:hypothetical protein [Desulfosporosinus sp. OT]EGW39293.1 hypothetical protein DOT_2755 [Desulfosporosinus sp. OT]